MFSAPVKRRHLLLGVLVMVTLGLWLVFYRSWYLSGDDYLHVGVGNHEGGAFTLREWWDSFAHDWSARNGRFSDAAVRLALRPGEWLFPVLAPTMLTAVGVLVALAAGGQRKVASFWVWLAGLLSPALVMSWSPQMFGSAAFWASGATNYVLPLLTTLGVLLVLVKAFTGVLPWAWVPAAGALVVLNDVLHEMSASAQAFMLVGLLVVQARARRAVPRQAWVLAGVIVVAFVVHMSAPGMWQRAGTVAEINQGGPVETLVHSMALSASTMYAQSPYAWLLLGAVLVLLALRSGGDARVVWWAGAGSVGAFVLASAAYQHRTPVGTTAASGVLEGMWPHSLAVVATLLFSAVCVGMALVGGVAEFGYVPLLAWLALFGNALFLFGGGLIVPRVFFPTGVLLVLLVLSLVAGLRLPGPLFEKAATVGVVAAMLFPVLIWADVTRVRLVENRTFVTQRVEQVLEKAAHRKRGTIRLPMQATYSDLSYGYAFLLPRYEQPLRAYYSISPRVKLVNINPIDVK